MSQELKCDLNDLFYYVQVVEHQGFAPAGRALGVPKSRLSRRIAQLESRLGVRLIQRSTRRFSVTEIGHTYYMHCKAMLIEAEAAEEAVAMTRSEPRGVVRMSCPVAMLDARVGDMVADFMAKHPQVIVHLEATNRQVDVVAEGFDIAIRVRPPPLQDSDLHIRVLGDRGQCLVASPSLLRAHGMPAMPVDLSGLPSLALSMPQGEHVWTLYGPDGALAQIPHHPRLVTRGMRMLCSAALAGVGVVQLPRMMILEHLKEGRLVQVLPQWQPKREIIYAVFASRRGLLPSVRALIDHLAEQFEALDED